MALKLPLFQLDAFASKPFAGNPAAVCPLKDWVADELMLAIAAENNLSETAFIVGADGEYRIRWFTPKMEVDLCGHATLASGYVVNRWLEPGRTEIRFESRSGPLGVSVEAQRVTLDFPAAPLTSKPVSDDLVRALGGRPRACFSSLYEMAVFESQAQVAGLTPDFRLLSQLVPVGIVVTAVGDEADFISRFFAPAAGIDEDPATGSAHCMLAPYWSQRLDLTEMRAQQLSARGGTLHCRLDGPRVLISGQVVPYLQGEIEV